MKLILAILFAGCTAAPSPRLVANLRHASLTASSLECKLPENSPEVVRIARGNLDGYAVLLWMRMDPVGESGNPEVASAIRNALPKGMTALDRETALYAASDSLP